MKNFFNSLLLENKVHIGHYLFEKKRFFDKNIEYRIKNKFFIRKKIILMYYKKLFFFLKIFLKKKKIILFVDTKNNHKYIYKELSKKFHIYYEINWKPGFLTNFKKNTIGVKRKLKCLPDIVFVIDTNKNKVALKECLKKDIISVSLTDSNYIKGTSFFIPMNDDSESSIIFFINQFIILLKKIDVSNRLNKKNYVFDKKIGKFIYFLKIKKKSDLYVKKKYFLYCMSKILKLFQKNKKDKILNTIKKVCNYYNEKIKILGFKKYYNKNLKYYNHNNKFIVLIEFIKNPSNILLYHIVFNLKNLFGNYFFYNPINLKYSNILNYIRKKKIKFKRILLI
ncbi:30S ribosomal protein S2 [Candidatus Vidania fulgoroideorum]